jgi:hypothetical protein
MQTICSGFIIQCVRKVAVHLGYGYLDLVVSIEVAVEVCCLFHCNQLKCNTGKVCNCLLQFLLTVVLSVDLQHLYKCTATYRTYYICAVNLTV